MVSVAGWAPVEALDATRAVELVDAPPPPHPAEPNASSKLARSPDHNLQPTAHVVFSCLLAGMHRNGNDYSTSPTQVLHNGTGGYSTGELERRGHRPVPFPRFFIDDYRLLLGERGADVVEPLK